MRTFLSTARKWLAAQQARVPQPTIRYFAKAGAYRDAPALRALIRRLGIAVTVIIITLPPIGFASVDFRALRTRALEQASLGAKQVEVQLLNNRGGDWLNEVSTNVLHAMRKADNSVVASWLTDKDGGTLMFSGESATGWPEIQRRATIKSSGFEGVFHVAVSTREVWLETLLVALAFLFLGLATHYCFTRWPLAALDAASQLLKANHEVLQQQNGQLLQQEEKLRAQNLQLDAAISNMAQGLAMFDSEQRLVVCNSLYADLYGLTPEQVKPGTTIRQLLEYPHAAGVFGTVDFETFVRDWLAQFTKASSQIQKLADGRILSIVRRPMPNGGLVSSTEDITERQELHALLEQQNLWFDVALKNMSQGLCMFDAEQRLLVANDRYAAMYDLTREQVRPGTTFRQILECRIAMGAYAGSAPEDYINERLSAVRERVASTKVHELSDGRVIAILHQPMADGGWVATHQDITEQRRSDAKIAHMALHDALTSLPNRVLLNERLEHALTRVKRGEIVAAHLLDLDHFKNVNDTMGHAAGDKLLVMVAERLRGLIRQTDTIARMGGDEFAIVQVAIEQPSDATVLAHRIIEVICEPYDIDGHKVIIGTSVGIAVGPTDGLSPDQLMRNADLALYRAKGKGRGMYRFFEPEMDTQMQARRLMENDLRKALIAHEFDLHFQPVVNLEHDEISGFEALLRWHHPEKGLIPPGEFIPLAEENGFIVQLGEWALRSACATAAAWPEHLKVAVNLSPVQFRNPGLVSVVFNALATSGLPAHRLELEITEAVLLEDNEATLGILFQLRELGVRIAMDDFGTGYSSLSYLQSFPFDKIKIDRSFIKDLADGVGSLNIVRAVAALANGLGMETTAEGVETREQWATVRSEGCTEMQGYLFSKAIPAHEIEPLLAKTKNGKGARSANAA